MFLHAMGGRWEGLPHCCEYVQVCEASSFITGTGRIGIVLIALISVYLQTHTAVGLRRGSEICGLLW